MRVSQQLTTTLREAPTMRYRRRQFSKRSLKNGGIEMKVRTQKESRIVPLTNIVVTLQDEIHEGMYI
ncbi:MAG: hypothetical protein NVS4B12_11450 [Ktedonobacteraceae bacterium]